MGTPVTPKAANRTARDSYIVHVYRRSDEPGHEVAGLVEPVEQGDALAFTGRDELWAALVRVPKGRRRSSVGRRSD